MAWFCTTAEFAVCGLSTCLEKASVCIVSGMSREASMSLPIDRHYAQYHLSFRKIEFSKDCGF